MHDVKMIYEQISCKNLGAFVDCPLLYLEGCYQPINDEPYCCELDNFHVCDEDFATAKTRKIVECKQLKNFSAYVDDCSGYWAVLETSRGERRCDYLEVDGKILFDNVDWDEHADCKEQDK